MLCGGDSVTSYPRDYVRSRSAFRTYPNDRDKQILTESGLRTGAQHTCDTNSRASVCRELPETKPFEKVRVDAQGVQQISHPVI